MVLVMAASRYLGFFAYIAFSSYQALLAKVFPDNLGTAMAWSKTAMNAGITIGSIFSGWIIHQWTFVLLPVICGGFAVVGGLWNVWVKNNQAK